jgi:hypothetical protein
VSVIVKFKPKSESVTNFNKNPRYSISRKYVQQEPSCSMWKNMKKLKTASLPQLISIMCTTPFHIKQKQRTITIHITTHTLLLKPKRPQIYVEAYAF